MNILLIVLSSFFYVLCLPPFSFWFFAPILLVPIFLVIERSNNFKTKFGYGFLYGFSLYLFVFTWVPRSCSALLDISLVWGWLIGLLIFVLIGIVYGLWFCVIGGFWQKSSWLVIFFWPGFERLLLFIFPFTIGYGWSGSLGGIQIVDLFGVYFLSLLSALYSYLIYFGIKNKPLRMKSWYLLGLIIILQFGYGAYKTAEYSFQKQNNTQQFVLLKTGIKPISKRDDPQKTYQNVLSLLGQASKTSKDNAILVLPESIFVQAFKENDLRIADLYKQILPTQTLIFGFNVYKDGEFYNSMGMLVKTEQLTSINEKNQIIRAGDLAIVYYSKNNLLLLGEYFPFEKILFQMSPQLKKITESSRFRAGDKSINFEAGNLKIFPFICIESMYGSWVAENCRHQANSNLLLNISEDGWFQSSHGSELHALVLNFRAIEMRKPLVRCVNVGICMALNQWGGSILRSEKPPISEINDAQTYQVEVPIGSGNSFFVKGGHFFEYIIQIFTFLAIVWFVLAKLKALRKTSKSAI